MKDYEVKHEMSRRQVWIGVVSGIAHSANAINSDTMIIWADKALAAFDSKFYMHNLREDKLVQQQEIGE